MDREPAERPEARCRPRPRRSSCRGGRGSRGRRSRRNARGARARASSASASKLHVERGHVVERGPLARRRAAGRAGRRCGSAARHARRRGDSSRFAAPADLALEPAGEPEVLAAVLGQQLLVREPVRARARRGGRASAASASSHSRTAASGSVGAERGGARGDRVGAARELDDLAAPMLGRRAVEIERGVLVEPARVRLPDRAHAPVDAAVAPRRARGAPGGGSRASPSTRRGRRSSRRRSRRARTAPRRGSARTPRGSAPRRGPVRGGRAGAARARGRSPVAPSRRTRARCACRSPRIVTRFGKWPNSAENMLPDQRDAVRRAATRRASRWSRRRAR